MLGFPEPKNTRGADWKLAHDWGWIHVWEDDVGTRQADWLVPSRFIWATGTGMVLGMALGMARGSREAGLRFLAENAHRPPKTVEGWYFYRKTKNYRVMLAAGREGGRQGMKLASVCATWATIESVMGDIGGVNKTREEKAERELWRTAAANTRGLVAGAVSAALVPLFSKTKVDWRTRRTLVGYGLGFGLFAQLLLTFLDNAVRIEVRRVAAEAEAEENNS